MTPPSWNSANAALVRDELIRRVGRGAPVRADGPRAAVPTRRARAVARPALAFVVALAVIVPASMFAFAHAPRTGIGARSGTPARPSASAPTGAGAGLEPGAALIGLWKVRAASEGTQTWVVFGAREVTVERDRALVFGSWATGDDRIAAVVYGWDGAITDRAVPWLERARSFEQRGSSRILRAEGGEVLATLTPTEHAPAPRSASPELMTVPSDGPTIASVLGKAAPAPDPGPALTVDALRGRWRTGDTASDGGRPFLTFAADGTYRGSDGCNGISGRWLLLPGDRLVLTQGGWTQVACSNLEPVPEWVGDTRSASIVAGALTLFDVAGRRLGSFDRR